ncbi:MAG TPA: biotin/lipoyl-containing protein [Candidatus Limnocylindrales bacterium]|nr:biotin/lipoyl-containing protein [Candidatus Limnocylindrales bacterium]
MPEPRDAKPHASTRRPAERDADLAGIDALIDRLVPALTAKLASTHLGELEVRDREWRIRLRRPPGAGWNGELRRAGDRATDRGPRGAAGHESHGHGRAGAPSDVHRLPVPGGSNGTGTVASPGATAGTGLASASSLAASAGHPSRPAHEDAGRRVATSPAVGVFRPGPRAAVGTRVREGDALGHVDVLGVPEEVPAPANGMVAELLVEGGTAVEYGQELVLVALSSPVEVGRP